MNRNIVILSAGRDAELLHTRNAVLKAAGYHVVAAHSPEELVEKFHYGDFDMVVLCHSFQDEELASLTAMLREKSRSTPVLVMTVGRKESRFAGMAVPNDPDSLVFAVQNAIDPVGHAFWGDRAS